jgi:hypothetical protein
MRQRTTSATGGKSKPKGKGEMAKVKHSHFLSSSIACSFSFHRLELRIENYELE